MLTLHETSTKKNTPDRRDFLRIGALGLGGLTLPWLLQKEAQAAQTQNESQTNTTPATQHDYIKDKAIVLLFLCGGPSQFETFDPHMEAPAPARSLTGEIKTKQPGITFGSTFKGLAKRADQLAVVRSYSPHNISDHATAIAHVLRAGDPIGLAASHGAMHTALHGSTFTHQGVPLFSQLIRKEIEDEYMQDRGRMIVGNAAGKLGATHQPFDPIGKGKLNHDMSLNLPLNRVNDRRALLKDLDRLSRRVDQSGQMQAMNRYRQQAVEMILGGKTRDALDVTKEDARMLKRYDTSHFQSGWLNKRPSTLGKRMLIARRLVEAGSRFITVGMAGWDNHGNDKHPGVVEGMRVLGSPVDHAVSAFLDDLKARGLSEKVLLVITGEFGRTVKIQAKGGRDHWPSLCPLVFAGGGLNMGTTVGESEKLHNVPRTEPYKLEHLTATLLHTMFDISKLRLAPAAPREMITLAEKTKPIVELF